MKDLSESEVPDHMRKACVKVTRKKGKKGKKRKKGMNSLCANQEASQILTSTSILRVEVPLPSGLLDF